MPKSSIDPVLALNLRIALQVRGDAVAKAVGHAPDWLYRVINEEAGILIPTLREAAR